MNRALTGPARQTGRADGRDSERAMKTTPESLLRRTLSALLPAALALAACGPVLPAGTKMASSLPQPKPAHRWLCPATLAFVRDDLVTPPGKWDSFLGEGVMEKTLNQPIDQMIKDGGGYEPSVASGRKYVAYYEDILAHPDKVREEYRGYGKSDDWIDIYLLTVRDGVTINQAFVDAVECRRANGWLEAQRESGGGEADAPLPQP